MKGKKVERRNKKRRKGLFGLDFMAYQPLLVI